MGEFAYYCGQRIKIGTCEDLMYLRADQVALIDRFPQADPRRDNGFRLRFPFPDEDTVRPGDFDADPGFRVEVRAPEVDHSFVQLTSNYPTGYLVNLPCPEGSATIEGANIMKNGYQGPTRITGQRPLNGSLMLILTCNACRCSWRCETLTDVEPVLAELHRRAREERRPGNRFGSERTAATLDTIAERIVEGYINPPLWVN